MSLAVPKNPGYLPGSLKTTILRELITISTAAQFHDLQTKVPVGALVLATAASWSANLPATANTQLGIGRKTATADPDKYGKTSVTAKDFAHLPSWTQVNNGTVVEDLALYAVDASGDTSTSLSIGSTSATVDVELQFTIVEPVKLYP